MLLNLRGREGVKESLAPVAVAAGGKFEVGGPGDGRSKGRRSGGPRPRGGKRVDADARARKHFSGNCLEESGRARAPRPRPSPGTGSPPTTSPSASTPAAPRGEGGADVKRRGFAEATEAIQTIALKWSSTDTATVRNHRRRYGEGQGRGGRACERVGGAARVTNRGMRDGRLRAPSEVERVEPDRSAGSCAGRPRGRGSRPPPEEGTRSPPYSKLDPPDFSQTFSRASPAPHWSHEIQSQLQHSCNVAPTHLQTQPDY